MRTQKNVGRVPSLLGPHFHGHKTLSRQWENPIRSSLRAIMVRIAIAGGTGGVGRTLVDELAKGGEHVVFVLSRKVSLSHLLSKLYSSLKLPIRFSSTRRARCIE